MLRLSAGELTVPILIIDAEDEELMDIEERGQAVYEAVKDKVPAKYVVIEGSHYYIYSRNKRKVMDMQLKWFDTHLKKQAKEK